MSHRVAQILEALRSAHVEQGSWVDRVFVQRSRTLSADSEMPAVVIAPGVDEPLQENLACIDSEILVSILLHAGGTSDEEVTASLFDQRRDSHVAIRTAPALGLDFVLEVFYRGAAEPEVVGEGEAYTGTYETLWAVQYRMNHADPQ